VTPMGRFVVLVFAIACGASTGPYVPLESHAKATGLALNGSVTGDVDCHDGGIVRNDLPAGTEAVLEYAVFPQSRCVHVDLVDAAGKVLEKWSDVAWCNGRVRNIIVKGDGGTSFIRATADSCSPTQLTLRFVPRP